MRRLVSLTLASVVILAATSAHALTQEEILKRRLDRMQQVDSQIRVEEQQRQEQMEETTAGFGIGASKPPTETLVMPDPVRQPHPEPKSGLFDPKTKPTAQPTPQVSSPPMAPPPAAQPAMQPQSTASAKTAPPASPPLQQPAGAVAPPPRDPKTASSLATMAAKAQASGDYQTALTMLDEAIAADPNDPDLRNNRGNVISNLGRPKDALVDYDRAIAAKTTDPAFFTNRGLAHERLGNRDRACTDYKKACDLGDCEFYKSYKSEGNCR
ncbi:tetratricopeptide repeat protein [Desulfovibrio sp. TomC]|uniref:tetratricopeptide repeat protein n=1 Tax=Desulfovibrio sp. TomC TaxID=1562888 RepID=UPI0005746DFF|nr:tetratricopeptide repeat protein [Desulfovibrio sp. TomC]KHK04208.1 hypothetical protein NY78_0652 [Desulfovibrio sp. TomC]